MSLEYNKKKVNVITDLLSTANMGVVTVRLLRSDQDLWVVEIDFEKGFTMRAYFILWETWNVIKARVKKLSEWDGICIVCFSKPRAFMTCFVCCETICKDCIKKHAKQSHTLQCVVCRSDWMGAKTWAHANQ